jgi:hypothetical protein
MKQNRYRENIGKMHAAQRESEAALLARAEGDNRVPALREPLVDRFIEALNAAHKRELSLTKSLKWLEAKRTPKPCTECRRRKLRKQYNWIKRTKKRLRDAEAVRKILDEICDIWPDFTRIPPRLWNEYLDVTGICTCGRCIAPCLARKGGEYCCQNHRRTNQYRKKRASSLAIAKSVQIGDFGDS